jgi:hypothetical protein
MPPYTWIHLESVFWVLAGGLLVASAIVLARGSRVWGFSFKKRSDEEIDKERHELAGVVSEDNRPVPLFIWLLIIGYLVWATAYVVFSGARGL